MDRRCFLKVLGVGGFALSGCALRFDEGIWNPCLEGGLPGELANHDLVRAVWEGVDPAQFWDCHVHVAGVGDGGTGVWITPQMRSLWHPWQSLQRRLYLNASCAETEGQVDQDFVRRLAQYLEAFPRGAKAMLLAFDFYYDETGTRREDRSAFYAPDLYAAELARRFSDRLEWICSVHPYRLDALEALEWAAEHGARAVKWLPSAMGMDPASAQCDRFYEALVRWKMPLLTHGGEEAAVRGGAAAEFSNPLRLRRALDHGVRVIIAHCASLGENVDLDKGPYGPRVEAFSLFARLMGEPRYEGRLFGEISAITQVNRAGTSLATVLTRTDWHGRLVNGSDYPLPGVMPLFSMRQFVEKGYLKASEGEVLSRIRRYNPLLFDFVLKRSLRVGKDRFAPTVFQSRRVFDVTSRRPSPE